MVEKRHHAEIPDLSNSEWAEKREHELPLIQKCMDHMPDALKILDVNIPALQYSSLQRKERMVHVFEPVNFFREKKPPVLSMRCTSTNTEGPDPTTNDQRLDEMTYVKSKLSTRNNWSLVLTLAYINNGANQIEA